MKINPLYSDLIEQLHYEKFALSDLLSFVLKDGIDIESDNYKKLEDKYLKACAKYELAKKELTKIYNLEGSWRLDFNNKEIIFLNEKK